MSVAGRNRFVAGVGDSGLADVASGLVERGVRQRGDFRRAQLDVVESGGLRGVDVGQRRTEADLNRPVLSRAVDGQCRDEADREEVVRLHQRLIG